MTHYPQPRASGAARPKRWRTFLPSPRPQRGISNPGARAVTAAKPVRRIVLLAALALTLAALTACGEMGTQMRLENPPPDPLTAPVGICALPACATVQVEMRDFAFSPSRIVVRAPRVRMILTNKGTLTHSFEALVGGGALRSPNIGPGQTGFLEVELTEGETSAICPIGGHAARGQRATIVRAAPA